MDSVKNYNATIDVILQTFKNPLNLNRPTGAVFSAGHPPPRRRETYRRSIHMFYI
jgi:hypothetical protein